MSEWEQFKAYGGIIADAKREERERILEELRTILRDSDVVDFYYDYINFDELDRQIRGEFL